MVREVLPVMRGRNGERGCGMIGMAKTIGRLIAVLVNAGIIERDQAVWILEPLKDKAEVEPQESEE